MRTLLVNGQIYSLAENFATSILIHDDVIAWIGSEGGAEVHRPDAERVIDLDGDLVTPGFVNLRDSALQMDAGFVHAERAHIAIADGWGPDLWLEHAGEPVAVVPRDPCVLRSRIAEGLPTALVPADPRVSGWQTVREAVYGISPAERVSARAAFSALTRGAWRLAGHPERGVLAVGSPATFVRWRVDDLVVQTPDERISNWSTDPRAATPGLPPLEPGAALPPVVDVWLSGRPQ